MHSLERGRWALVLAVLLAVPVSALAGPEIYSIEPESGPAGTPIHLKGTGLRTTGRIVFAVGRTISRARFKIVSDQEVEVIAPDYYRPGAAATVAVFTEHGAAVAMPATVQTVRSPVQGTNVTEIGDSFFHVLDGGVLSTAGAVAVIEQGGVVVQSSNPAMQFVKRGGTLLEFHNGNGMVFYEPGAKLGPGVVKPNRPVPVTLVRIPEITACPGVGPFRFVAAAAPDLARGPGVPPVIRGLSSRAAPAGAIVAVTGSGFARTIEVSFLGPTGTSRAAGFRVVSDHELRVEVPDADAKTAPQLIAVLTSGGLAITVPRNQTIRPIATSRLRRNPALLRAGLLWIGSGDIVGSVASQSIFISPGGLVTQAEANRVYFVQHDGRLGDNGQNPNAVFFEPGAIVPDRLKQAPVGKPVPVIVPSPVDQPFVIMRAPDVRG
jgi:IPT/TIG domain